MAKVTPSKARNTIRRALFAEIDGALSPSDKSKMWRYFGSSCAYCGREMDPSAREGHMDHLESHASGGVNHVSNTVLACRFCNGDEKRDMHWREFLRRKCHDQTTLRIREARIEEWVRSNAQSDLRAPVIPREEVEAQIQEVIAAFDAALAKLREAKRRAG